MKNPDLEENTFTNQENNGTGKRRMDAFDGDLISGRKRRMFSPITCAGGMTDFFYSLPEEVVLLILCKLSSSASSPADFIHALITCKRLNALGLNSLVLSKASEKMLAIKFKNWSESAENFLWLCADAGNVEAIYTLGMYQFYCLKKRVGGVALISAAANDSHAPSLYSLAVIQFNGSGGSRNDKDLTAGVTLCARAARLGHIDALRELGHCYQDGYGVKQNVEEGRRLIFRATAIEVAAALSIELSALTSAQMSAFGCENIPAPKPHPANSFLTEWFAVKGLDLGSDLRLCANSGCGRVETRSHEFRRCSICGTVNYCSRACQSIDWKVKHKSECVPVVAVDENIGGNDANGDVAMPEVVGDGEVHVDDAVLPEVHVDDAVLPEVDREVNGDDVAMPEVEILFEK